MESNCTANHSLGKYTHKLVSKRPMKANCHNYCVQCSEVMITCIDPGDMFREKFGEYAGWAQAVSTQSVYIV